MSVVGAAPYGFVETKRKYMEEVLRSKGRWTLQTMLFCIYAGPEHPLYNLNLLSASMHLSALFSLVYKGNEGYKKLPKRRYEVWLFEGYGETEEEVEVLLKELDFSPSKEEVSEVYKVLYAIKPLILEWLTYTHETIYAPEFAYHIDYCIRNYVTSLPEPEGICMPNNYPEDWNCFGNDGVAKLLFDIVGFC